MKIRSRWIPALLALAGVGCPWVVALAVATAAVPHSHDHARPAHGHLEVVDLALHGHRHEPGTPPHDHSIVLAKAAAATRTSLVPVAAAPVRSALSLPDLAPGGYGSAAGPPESPPSTPRTLPVLRI